MFNPLANIFTEKYRPTLKELVFDDKEKIVEHLKNHNMFPNLLLVSRSPGTGKCLVKDEMFLIPGKGIISFEDYCKEKNITNEYTDIVENLSDSSGIVNTKYFYKGKSNTIKITTKNGFNIEGTPEHKIRVFDIQLGIIWKKLCNISKDDLIPILYDTQIFSHDNNIDTTTFETIRKNKPTHSHNERELNIFPTEMNEDLAYLIGVFVANGTFDRNNLMISTYKEWLQLKLQKIIKDNFGFGSRIQYDKRKKRNTYVQISCKQLGLFFEHALGIKRTTARYKIIPKIIFKSTKNIQMAFVNGLFEDASINKETTIEYMTASKDLAKQLQVLMLNLGYIITDKIKHTKGYSHDYHRMMLTTEHTRKFIEWSNGYFKNELVKFNKPLGTTNKLTYQNFISNYVSNRRKKYKISNNTVHKEKYTIMETINGRSIQHIKSVLHNLLREPYLQDLKMFNDNTIYLDRTDSIEVNHISKDVYDFNIPKTHSFITSGFVSHNTSLAKIIINDLKCDSLVINSSDDRNIETIREKVKNFCITQNSNGIRRCIFLDEADGMTKIAQDALRNTMETYSSNAFFILTANNENKISDAIKSRCLKISFAYPNKDAIFQYLENICKKEGIQYSEDGLKKLVEINYPSIRNCVVALQDLFTSKKPVVLETIKLADELYEEMWKLLKDKKWQEIKIKIMESTIDARELNSYIWQRCLEDLAEQNIKILQICCRNERDMSLGADAKIIMVTSLIEMVK